MNILSLFKEIYYLKRTMEINNYNNNDNNIMKRIQTQKHP